nr:hypothetical protein [Tanacetum cinerariifolium]
KRRNKVKVLTLRRLQKVGTAQRIDTSDDTVKDDVSNQGRMIADMDADADVVLEEAKDFVVDAKDGQDADVQEEESEPVELQEVLDIVATTKIITEVVTAASTTITAADVPIPDVITAAALILTAAPKLNRTIDWDEVIDHVNKKAKEDPDVKRYQALKRKPQTEAQARKNMMIYLKNVTGFKMDYFKGMSYDDIRPLFEAKFDSNVAF